MKGSYPIFSDFYLVILLTHQFKIRLIISYAYLLENSLTTTLTKIQDNVTLYEGSALNLDRFLAYS